MQPLNKLQQLAVRWYGKHLEVDWRKWTVAEAQQIFNSLGFTSTTWRIEVPDATLKDRF